MKEFGNSALGKLLGLALIIAALGAPSIVEHLYPSVTTIKGWNCQILVGGAVYCTDPQK